MVIVGIDIGSQKGGVAFMDSASRALIAVAPLPTHDGDYRRRNVNVAALLEMLKAHAPSRAFVEYVAARPTDSTTGAFSFGMARGAVEACLIAAGVPFTTMTPQTWKRAVNIPAGEQKDLTREMARQRWPAFAASFERVGSHDLADAAHIALAGAFRSQVAHDN